MDIIYKFVASTYFTCLFIIKPLPAAVLPMLRYLCTEYYYHKPVISPSPSILSTDIVSTLPLHHVLCRQVGLTSYTEDILFTYLVPVCIYLSACRRCRNAV